MIALALMITMAGSAKNLTLHQVWSASILPYGGMVLESSKGPIIFRHTSPTFESELYLASPVDGQHIWSHNHSANNPSSGYMYNLGPSIVQVGVRNGQGFIPDELHLFGMEDGRLKATQFIDDGYIGFDQKPFIVDGNAFFLAPSNKWIKVSHLWRVDGNAGTISEVKSFADGSTETDPQLVRLLANKTIGFSRCVYRFDSAMRAKLVDLDDKELGRPRQISLLDGKYILADYESGHMLGQEDEPKSTLPMKDSAKVLYQLGADGDTNRLWINRIVFKHSKDGLPTGMGTSSSLGTLHDTFAFKGRIYGLIFTPKILHGLGYGRNLIEFDTQGRILHTWPYEQIVFNTSGSPWVAEQGLGYPDTSGYLKLHPIEDLTATITLPTKPGLRISSLSIDPKRQEFALLQETELTVFR